MLNGKIRYRMVHLYGIKYKGMHKTMLHISYGCYTRACKSITVRPPIVFVSQVTAREILGTCPYIIPFLCTYDSILFYAWLLGGSFTVHLCF